VTRYMTKGVCARVMDVETDGKTVGDVVLYGGCRGQAQALPRLVKGLALDDAIARLKGVVCRGGTSCSDQLARILEHERDAHRKSRRKLILPD